MQQLGFIYWFCLFFLYAILQFTATLWTEWSELQRSYIQFGQLLNEKKQLRSFAMQEIEHQFHHKPHHLSLKFDYTWHNLGEYNCIMICQPDCMGTHHWLLKTKSLHFNMQVRVGWPDVDLHCQSSYPIKLDHIIIDEQLNKDE